MIRNNKDTTKQEEEDHNLGHGGLIMLIRSSWFSTMGTVVLLYMCVDELLTIITKREYVFLN